MEPRHRLVLSLEKPFLIENLDVSAVFLASLVSKDTITNDEMERLMKDHLTRNDKVSIFLGLIETKGSHAFPAFLAALQKSEQSFIQVHLQQAVRKTEDASTSSLHGSSGLEQMDPVHCDILKQNLPYLVKNLDVNTDLLAHLTSADILNRGDRQRIKGETESDEKVFTLRDILVQKTPNAYQAFLDAIEATGQGAIVSKLKEDERRKSQQVIQTFQGVTAVSSERGADAGGVGGLSVKATEDMAHLKWLCWGSDVNSTNPTGGGWTGLHRAAANGWYVDVRTLLRAGANIHALCSYGKTALHYACVYGSTPVVRELLQAGADTRLKDDWGKTPRDCALEHGYDDIVQLLPQ